MPLIDPATALPIERLRELRREALTEASEMAEILGDAPGASIARTARGMTARALVADAIAWASRGPEPSDRGALVAEINLLHDVTIVAAEYYKMFVREPTPERPAGRI